jgi:signal transduction histidine kinase
VLVAQADLPDAFSERDLRFLRAVARWVGGVVQRAELLERTAADATEQGRRAGAEELIMVVAHDLRNYLAPLRTRTEMLQRHGARIGDTETLHQSEALQASLTRLEAMIADLLDVARLEHGLFALVIRETDLVTLVHETAGRFRTDQAEVQVRAPEHLRAGVDPDRVRQALENLLANAVRHTAADTPVEVTLATESRGEARTALLSVRDHGPGLPPELLPHLFERFATGGRSAGLGLGLYLAHRVATAHGGLLEVQSTPGQGTCFTLTLPLGPATQDPDHSGPTH